MRIELNTYDTIKSFMWRNPKIKEYLNELYHPNKYINWFSNKVLKGLDWIGVTCNPLESKQVVHTYTIHTKQIEEILHKYRYTVQRIYDEDLRYVIMGHNTFDKFISNIHHTNRFHIDLQCGMNGRRFIMGLEIILVPWFKGLVMIPKIDSRRQ